MVIAVPMDGLIHSMTWICTQHFDVWLSLSLLELANFGFYSMSTVRANRHFLSLMYSHIILYPMNYPTKDPIRYFVASVVLSLSGGFKNFWITKSLTWDDHNDADHDDEMMMKKKIMMMMMMMRRRRRINWRWYIFQGVAPTTNVPLIFHYV